VAADAARLVRRLRARFPGAEIGLLAVKPSPSRAALLGAQRELNLRLRRLARRTAGVTFLDTASPLLGPDGQPDPRFFVADRLHLNEAGYDVWRGVPGPFVSRTGR
jgi:lysophospholipase L1-like esterase